MRDRADGCPGRTAFTFLPEGEEAAESWTYAQLDLRARAAAAWLQERARPGERVVISHASPAQWLTAFLGCMYAGVVAVPLAPLGRARDIAAMAGDCGASLALLDREMEGRFAGSPALAPLPRRVVEEIPLDGHREWRPPALDGDSVLLIQYTSGSTGAPKGAVIDHGNVLANQRMIQAAFRHDEGSTFVGWLPLFHDMGLMGTVIQPLFVGASAVLMPPGAFLQKPARWLRAIMRYRAHTSGGPNFAYALCCQRVRAEEIEGLDLSSWRVAFNGAEPVSAETIERFTERLAPYGFRAESVLPCYGLAEATLFVSGHSRDAAPRIVDADRDALERGLLEPSSQPSGRRLVSCGRPASELSLAIVGAAGEACREGEIGEIHIAGRNVTRGYWRGRAPEAGSVPPGGPEPLRRFRTGDLGTLLDGELFVLGRVDDLIIIRGRNYHPQDLEHSASASDPALRAGCAAAFTLPGPADEARLVLVQETNEALAPEERRRAVAAIRAAMARDHGVMLHDVVLVPKRAIPRTTSGKVCRRACRDLAAKEDAARAAAAPGEASSGREAARAWLRGALAQVLGASLEDVPADAAPLALGLDSLGAARVCHRAHDELGVDLPFERLLAASSIDALSASFTARRAAPAASDPPPPAAGDTFPMSARQRAMWFFQQYAPDSDAYQVSVAGRLLAPVEPARLAAAVEHVAGRHPILRGVFEWVDGEPRCRLLPASGQPMVEVRPVSGLSAAELDRALEQECHRPLRLDQGPTFRVVLFRGGPCGDVLLVSAHHIIVDLWSLAVLFQELDAALGDPPAPLAPAAPRLELELGAREAEQVRAFEAAGGPERLLARLAGALPLEPPPAGWDPPDASSAFAIATAWIEIDPETTRALRELSGRQSVTLYTVLLSAYAAVLHRYCGVDDFVVGSPTWSRSPELRTAVGCFVNTMVVRCDLAGDPPFAELARRLNGAVLDGLAQADYPYSLAVRRWRSATRREALAEALFTLHGVPFPAGADPASFALGRAGGRLELANLRLESLAVARREFDFPFDLALGEADGGLAGYLATSRKRVPAELGAQMARHFAGLLKRVARDAGWRVSSDPLVGDAERELLERWNAPRIEEAGTPSLVDLFDRQVERAPERPAVLGRGSALTYAELDGRSRRLATVLREVAGDGAVGLLLPASPDWAVAMLASMRARRAFVPLESTDPVERLAAIAGDAGLRILVSSAALADTAVEVARRLPGPAAVVVVDGEARRPAGLRVAGRSALDAARPFQGGGPAPGEAVYVVYTSGSTGAPKGVPVTHGNLEHLMRWLAREFRIGAATRTLQSLPVCFDFGLEEVLSTLLAGGTLCSFPADERRDPDDYLDLLERHGITMAYWTPSLAAGLVSRGRPMPSLRVILLGGETLERSLVKRLRDLLDPACRIFNGYGPTEAAINSSMYEVRSWGAAARWSRSIPIGGPSGRTRLYVLSRHGALAPVGVPGELFIGGPGVASGYLRRPGLTAERFVADPASLEPGGRMYRTGDRVRWLADGSLEFLGRVDHQVKVRGYRIEPGEIEHLLRRAPGVGAAAVLAAATQDGVELVAFVQAAPEAAWAARELLRRRLPHYMVPTRWVELAAFPSTANGKLDRAALAALAREPVAPAGAEAPHDPIEAEIQTSWQAVLGLASVPRHASFFDLGGHSLAAIAVHRELESKLALSFPVSALFEHSTVALLARYLSGGRERQRRYSLEGIDRAARLKGSLRELRERARSRSQS
jgi:amino acid adenylation domain-containing protein